MYIEVNDNKKWKRSIDGYLAGVCEGLGQSFGINPNLLRIVWLISVFAFGTGIFLYVLAAMILPREDRLSEYQDDKILGVCRRLSERSGMELSIIRLLAVLSAFSSLGITVLVYFLLHFLMGENTNKVAL